jgi:uncharacterized membrane protein
MTWLILGLIPPLLWSVNNMMDQYLSRRFFPSSAATLQGLQGVVTGLAGLLMLTWVSTGLSLHVWLIMLGAGMLLPFAYIPYTLALQRGQASLAIPLFQLIPVFVCLTDYVVFGKTLNAYQLIAGGLLIYASVFMVATPDLKTFEWRTLVYMACSCAIITAFMTIATWGQDKATAYDLAALGALGSGLSGFFILSVLRKGWLNVYKSGKAAPRLFLTLNALQEVFSRSATYVFHLALPLAPSTALLQVVGTIQPFYIIILAYPCYWLSKRYFEKPMARTELIWHLAWLGIMVVCLAILYLSPSN